MNARTEPDMTAGLARDVVAIRIGPSPGISIGRAQEHQDFLALADAAAADLDILGRSAEERLHRAFEADRFLERIARQRWIAAQPCKFFRKAREAIDRGTEAVDRGVNACREQRAYQHRRLCRGDIAGIDPGMDAGAEPSGCEIVALALLLHIGLMRLRAFDRGLAQFVRWPERVKDHAGIGQQMLASLLFQPDG